MPARSRSRSRARNNRRPQTPVLSEIQWDVLQALETLRNADRATISVIASLATRGQLPVARGIQDDIFELSEVVIAWLDANAN